MKLSFQGINSGESGCTTAFNGNGQLTLTADNLKFACAELGIPDDAHTLRRAARAFDLYHSGKVEHVNNHTFKVASQYDRERPYRVQIKQTPYLKAGCYAYCTCQDWMNYSGDQDLPDVNFWCKHSIAALVWLHNNGSVRCVHTTPSTGKRIVNECGSQEAKALQDKLNGQRNSQKNNGNGAKAPSQDNIDPSAKIFMEADKLDETQILTGEGSKAHKLSDGSYCISFLGICNLADKYSIITETLEDIPSKGFVTVRAMRNDTKNARKSIQPVNGSFEIAEGKAKRNAIRMLLPVQDIRALEYKAKLTSEFDWQKAKAKCLELVNDANLSIIIHDLVQAGKLRQDNPSHYDRTEWLQIHAACQKDASVPRDPKSLNRWSYNSAEFLEKCREVIAKVREEKKSVEANEMPLQTEVKRKLQMDKKLRTWLIEADGTKKEISCREIAEQFDSLEKGIIKRLRMGIDSGADISTVELD
jgi:hypothetical protein